MFHQHKIVTYQKSAEEVSAAISRHLSSEYILEWATDLPDYITENPYPYYPWRDKTGKSLSDFKLFMSAQRALMDEAILKAQEDFENGV